MAVLGKFISHGEERTPMLDRQTLPSIQITDRINDPELHGR
jgi:hypothetical protein